MKKIKIIRIEFNNGGYVETNDILLVEKIFKIIKKAEKAT